jgi:hypothetical protein
MAPLSLSNALPLLWWTDVDVSNLVVMTTARPYQTIQLTMKNILSPRNLPDRRTEPATKTLLGALTRAKYHAVGQNATASQSSAYKALPLAMIPVLFHCLDPGNSASVGQKYHVDQLGGSTILIMCHHYYGGRKL